MFSRLSGERPPEIAHYVLMDTGPPHEVLKVICKRALCCYWCCCSRRGGLIGYFSSLCLLLRFKLIQVRLPTQSENERNFHVFYQMCKGGNEEEKERWELEGMHAVFTLGVYVRYRLGEGGV